MNAAELKAARDAEVARLRREYPRIRLLVAEAMAALAFPAPGECKTRLAYSLEDGLKVR